MSKELSEKISGFTYIAGVPLLFISIIARSHNGVAISAAILSVSWLVAVKEGVVQAAAKMKGGVK